MASEPYELRLTRQARKDLTDLRPWTERAIEILRVLSVDPWRGHPLKGSLRGARSLELSLPGGGAYRAVYIVLEGERACLVFLVGPHEGVYQRAERRMRAYLRERGQGG